MRMRWFGIGIGVIFYYLLGKYYKLDGMLEFYHNLINESVSSYYIASSTLVLLTFLIGGFLIGMLLEKK